MGALRMWLRAEMRARWRSLVSLALIAGFAGGAAIAAAAGARRSETAYPRFLRAQDAYHAITGGGAQENYPARRAALKRLPQIADHVELLIVGGEITLAGARGRLERTFTAPDGFLMGDPTGRHLYETNRAKILEGRFADRADPNEVMIAFSWARRHDVRVGDTITAGVGFDAEDFAHFGLGSAQPLRRLPLQVVGITAAPGDFDAVGQASFIGFVVTPAFFDAYADLIPPPVVPDLLSLGVHLEGGSSAADEFKKTVEGPRFNIDVPIIEPVLTSGVQKTMRLYAAALWIVAALIAVALFAVFGQTLSRQIHLDAVDYPALRAMGVTRVELFALGLARAAIVAVAASPIAVAVAYALSFLVPIGNARVAEIDTGLKFDAGVIGAGVGILVVGIAVLAVWPAMRAARVAGVAPGSSAIRGQRPSRVASFAARSSRSPAAGLGLRMALEPGSGRTAVPVRSTVLAVAIGLAAVTATLGIGRSLAYLIDTPELAGLTYDAIVPNEGELSDEEVADRLRAFPFVERMTSGTGLNVAIDGVDSFIVAFEEGAPIGYATIQGRDPTSAMTGGLPEISLGPTTFRRLGLELGDTVAFSYPKHEEGSEEEVTAVQRAVVVGVAAIPPLPWAVTEPGEGAVMTTGGIASFTADDGGCCFVRFRPGTDLAVAQRTLNEAGYLTFLRTSRADLATLEHIASLPIAVTMLFVVIALAALIHVLVTGVRRRRRDLAMLKALGLVARQLRAAVAWQATAIAALCVAFGVPAGIALGRVAWRAVAGQFGVVPVSVTPVALLAAVAAAIVVLANLIALGPARSAARTKAAVVLRTE